MKRLNILDSVIASISAVSIDCRALNRTRVSDSTCGKCIENFVGDSSTKTSCVPKVYASVTPKSCPNDCSSSGVCQFLDINNRNRISSCNLQNDLCLAKCVCNENIHGDDCSISDQDLAKIQETQTYVLTQLQTVSFVEAPSAELLLTTMSSAARLLSASSAKDLSDKSITLSRNIISATMKSALSLDMPAESITIYNAVIDGFIDVSSNNDIDNSAKASVQSMYESYVDAIGKTVMKNTSNSNITITTPNMQIVVNKIRPINTVSSLCLQPPHELSMLSSSLESSRSVYDRSIPLLLSATRSNLYDSSTTTSSNSSANLPRLELASNPLRIQLDCSLMNSTQVQLVLQNSEKKSFDKILPITKPIRTTCFSNSTVEYSYTCEYTDVSNYNITVKCDGSKNITYTTECPSRLRTPTCGVLSDIGKCSLVSYSAEKIVCSCDICSTSDMRRRRLSITTVAYHVSGMIELVYEDYSSVSSKPMSTETVKNTLIVSLTYALVWIIIVVSVPIKGIIHRRLEAKEVKGTSKVSTKVIAVVPEDAAESLALEKRLRDYINLFLPAVYKDEQSYLMKLITQIIKNHLYLSLFIKSRHESTFLNLMEAFKVLTVMSSSMFILVVLYNAQYPSNDHSCESFDTIDMCLKRKLFRGRSYCAWESDECIFNEPEYSVFEEVFLAWVQMIVLAPLSAFIAYAFDGVILAPTSTYVSQQLMVSHGTSMMRRLSQIGSDIRRMSLALGNQARRLSSVLTSKVSDANIKKKAMLVKSTITVSQGFVDTRRHVLDLFRNQHHQRHDQFNINLADASDFDIAQLFYQIFTRSFKNHRKHLSERDRSKFDDIWSHYFPLPSGSDQALSNAFITDINTGTVVTVDHNDNRFKLFSSLLFAEILLVQETANEIYSNIKDAPTHIVGAELLKSFLIDLLGRDTKEARIFEASFENNIKSKKVVSVYLKMLMISAMVGLNIYFVYISMLYCSDKDHEWQLSWMSIFITNLGIDIGFNYMSEAYLLSFLIPRTISSKIVILQKKLNRLVSSLVNNSNHHHHHHHHHLSFSTPDYFFISTNLARRCKDIPESALILAYTDTHMPCASDNNNHINSNDITSNDTNAITWVLLSGGLATLLKLITIQLFQITALPEFAQVYNDTLLLLLSTTTATTTYYYYYYYYYHYYLDFANSSTTTSGFSGHSIRWNLFLCIPITVFNTFCYCCYRWLLCILSLEIVIIVIC